MTDTADTGDSTAAANPAAARPLQPLTVKYAVLAIGVSQLVGLVFIVAVWIARSTVSKLLIDNNNLLLDHKNKKAIPKADYLPGSSAVSKDIHQYQIEQTTWGLLFIVAISAIAWAIWRGRGTFRWLYLFLAIVPFSGAILPPLLGVLALGGGGLLNVLLFLRGVPTFVAVILLLVTASRRYFAETKALRLPAGAATARTNGAGRPSGLRGLFAPPPPREGRATPGKGAMARKPATTRTADGPVVRSKAKVRAAAVDVPAEAGPPDVPEPVQPARGRSKSRRV